MMSNVVESSTLSITVTLPHPLPLPLPPSLSLHARHEEQLMPSCRPINGTSREGLIASPAAFFRGCSATEMRKLTTATASSTVMAMMRKTRGPLSLPPSHLYLDSPYPRPRPRLLSRRRPPMLPPSLSPDDHASGSSSEEVPGVKLQALVKASSGGFKQFLNIISSNYLTSVLLCGVLCGLVLPKLGQSAYQAGFSKWATFGIFIFSGLTLRTTDLGKALEAWPSLIFGLVSVLLLTPLGAAIILRLHLVPREFVTGLAIFCCVPTTLSSGVALSQMAGANAAVALSLTVVSNILGILTMPLAVSNLVARGTGVLLPVGSLLKTLVQTLVLPLFLGKVVREIVPGMVEFIDKHINSCSALSAICLSTVPWMQVSCSRDLLFSLRLQNLVAMVVLGIIIHLVFLVGNTMGMIALHHLLKTEGSLKKPVMWAIILTASQKTLPITIAIIGGLNGLLGEAGLLILPCVAAHVNQIIIDTFLVNLWIRRDLHKVA